MPARLSLTQSVSRRRGRARQAAPTASTFECTPSLRQDVPDVRLHRRRADPELHGDLGGRRAVGQRLEDSRAPCWSASRRARARSDAPVPARGDRRATAGRRPAGRARRRAPGGTRSTSCAGSRSIGRTPHAPAASASSTNGERRAEWRPSRGRRRRHGSPRSTATPCSSVRSRSTTTMSTCVRRAPRSRSAPVATGPQHLETRAAAGARAAGPARGRGAPPRRGPGSRSSRSEHRHPRAGDEPPGGRCGTLGG